MVGLDGLEPSTSRLSGVRSNHLSYKPFSSHSFGIGSRHHVLANSVLVERLSFFAFGVEVPTLRCTSPSLKADLSAGGDDGVRTHDPLLAGQVLSQLSYTPVSGLLSLFQRSQRFYPLFLISEN